MNCALYLRSSKDRKDVSIHHQRQKLTELAKARGYTVTAEFTDAVESGSQWGRPGFQRMIEAVRNKARGWSTIFVLDTSRISRRSLHALIFEEQECAPRGVSVVYSSVPDGDGPTISLMRAVLRGIDEWHSLTSREKGLAGMAQTVRQGYRGAGKAPMGYSLKKIDVGIVREGRAVTKSVLEPNEDAPAVAEFLKLRASGVPRKRAAEQAGIKKSPSTLVGVEWNALTYAGCTTLHVFKDCRKRGERKTGKRQARKDWVVQPDTHKALITKAEAEVLLTRLERSTIGKAVSESKRGISGALLTGILKTPAGRSWETDLGSYYREPKSPEQKAAGRRRKYLPQDLIDRAVVDQLVADLSSAEYAAAIAQQLRSQVNPHADRIKALHKQIAKLNTRIDRATRMAADMEFPETMMRTVDAFERERRELIAEQAALKEEAQLQGSLAEITTREVQDLLGTLADRFKDAPIDQLRKTMSDLVDRVELDPVSLACEVTYRSADINRRGVALPRGLEPRFPP